MTSQVSTGIDLTVFKLDEQSTVVNPPGNLIPNYPQATAGFDPIATSGTQTYTIYVDNLGTQDASDVRVVDTLPAGTKFLSASGDDGIHVQPRRCGHRRQRHLCRRQSARHAGGVLRGGGALGNQFATITIKLFATPNVQPDDAQRGARRPAERRSPRSTRTTTSPRADTTVKTTGGGGQRRVQPADHHEERRRRRSSTSSPITYVITIGNTGTDPAVNVTFQDVLPAGTTFISALDDAAGPNKFTCSAAGSVVTCSGATLSGTVTTIGGAPGTRTVTIMAFSPTQPGTITNTATVDPDKVIPEGERGRQHRDGRHQGGRRGRVHRPPGEQVRRRSVARRSATRWRSATTSPTIITAKNAGTDPAFQVVLRDQLPEGVTFQSAQDTTGGDGAFSCTYASAAR